MQNMLPFNCPVQLRYIYFYFIIYFIYFLIKKLTKDLRTPVKLIFVNLQVAYTYSLINVNSLRLKEAGRPSPSLLVCSVVRVMLFTGVGPAIVTTNAETFKAQLDAVKVIGGADCPEPSLTALLQALNLVRPNSYVYVFTDASAKDYFLLPDVLSLVQRKQSQVSDTQCCFLY